MDIPRAPKKKRGRYIMIAAIVVGVVAVTAALSRLQPAAPSVDRATLWIDTVQQGTMVRDVRGPGTLEPEQVLQVAATTSGRVENLPLRPGAKVVDTTLITVLTNPDEQLQLLTAQQQVASQEAQLIQLRTSLQTQRLTQQSTLANLHSEYEQARRLFESDSLVSKKTQALVSENQLRDDKDKAQALEAQLESQKKQLAVLDSSMADQIKFQEQQVDRLRAVAKFREERVASMKVRAGTDGVLTELPLEPGQWVTEGSMLAKIAKPGHLKAVLKVPETQAVDVTLGQQAAIDTHNGIAKGHVMRIYPSSDAGTVTVEVAFDEQPPRGARTGLSVDGTIQIEKLNDVLHMGRPAYGQANSTVGIFRLTPDGKYADRVNVKLGVSSVNEIQVLSGLKPGDKVIVSDMSNWDAQSRVRLK
ncbi:MAG TPA: HlyD family efflux transporter periplasmic adaptor subunit [Gemmatimonadaceae bacterium]|nr:HlyD family efflux transporter periplasmic adaptor subunit [Gemmatimonadaceae bacterium]